jgi:chromosome segregation ATPase
MQIPAEYFSEVNYTGTRLVKIEDETVRALQDELTALQKEANPFLEKMEAITPELDPVYDEIRELELKKNELQKKVAPARARYDAIAKNVEEIDVRAAAIKAKITPIVIDLVKDELGEFEIPLHTMVKEGEMFVEIRDEIEERVKQLRAIKAKNA